MKRFKPAPIVGPARPCHPWRGTALACALALISTACQAAGTWPPAPRIEVSADLDAGALPPSVTAETLSSGLWRCTFRYQPEIDAQSVTLAGTFNGWSRDATPMQGPSNATWTVSLDLPPGEHLYKFVVNGERWFHDPRNPAGVSDGHAGQNSVLRLGHVANLAEANARTGDGRIEGRALLHAPSMPLYFQWVAAGRALVRLRTLAHDVTGAWVATPDGRLSEMTLIEDGDVFALWEADAALPAGTPAVYTFVLQDGDLRVSSPQEYAVPASPTDVFQTPDWAKHAIWYQIFPERFRNGDPANDPAHVIPWTMDWFATAPWEGKDGQTFYKHFVFWRHYGGDIVGVEQQLPYLKELGVSAIYFNPIFTAASNHKYDTTSYMHMDDQFGVKGGYDAVKDGEDLCDPSTWKSTPSDKVFLAFIQKAHKMGFHVIIDAVFNHVGQPFPAYQDVKKNGQKSKYADWFNVASWDPFEVRGWGGFGAMPEFKKSATGVASESLKQHIFNVTRRWMDPNGDGDPSDGIDGWRLDVPNEIPGPFWVEWRALVKSINPNAYITGEIWDRADQWLDGQHFDAVMNYEFAKAACNWIFDTRHKITPSEIDRRYRVVRQAYPREATYVLQNLMNSHDTDRLASMAHNPDRAYDHANRVQDNGPQYDNAKPSPEEYRQARLAALLQMTYVGAPMVYYGDEVGMWGADDPTCRKPMLWKDLQPYEKPEENHVMDDQLAYYKQVIALRNAHPALRTGVFQTLLTDDEHDVWAFLRKDDNEQVVVVLSPAKQAQEVTVPLPLSAPTKWKGVFGAEGTFDAVDHKLTVQIPALGGVVLHAATPK